MLAWLRYMACGDKLRHRRPLLIGAICHTIMKDCWLQVHPSTIADDDVAVLLEIAGEALGAKRPSGMPDRAKRLTVYGIKRSQEILILLGTLPWVEASDEYVYIGQGSSNNGALEKLEELGTYSGRCSHSVVVLGSGEL